MLIRDWSADVCSSDLVAAPERRRDLEGLLDAGAQALLFDMGDQPADAARPIGLQFGRQLVGREIHEVDGVQAGHGHLRVWTFAGLVWPPDAAKVGSAECREEVRQNV